MALDALMAQIGPDLKSFAGEYEFHPSPPPPLTAASVLEVLDKSSIKWTNTKGGASAVYERSKKHPTWFVGDDGSVSSCCDKKYDNTGDTWELDNPGKPLRFWAKDEDPKAKGATPKFSAVLKDVPEEFQSRTVAGTDKTDLPNFKQLDKITPEMQAKAQKEFQQEQKKEAEKMEIRELISNDKEKQKKSGKLKQVT